MKDGANLFRKKDLVSSTVKRWESWSTADTRINDSSPTSDAIACAKIGACRWSAGRHENIHGTLARLTVLSVLAALSKVKRAFATTCSARCVDCPSIPPTTAQTLCT